MSKPLRTILLFLLLLKQISANIPIGNFFPYGIENGDSTLEKEDDAFSTKNITFNFPFFGRIYREVHISTNGILTFGAGSNDYKPQRFPLPEFRSVAAYWTDSDPRNGGDIFYREVNSSDILKRITDEIRLRFIGYKSFTSTWALIVTFDRVAQYGCGIGNFSCEQPCSNVLTYQTILTSNGLHSFTIFLYNELNFTSGTADCDAHAQVGFNAGDGKRFHLVPSSNSENIATTALTTSNVGVPGQWMFSIDGSDIEEGCNVQGKLEIFPRKMLYFGGEDIIIAGPCFNEVEGNIKVIFDGRIEVTCQLTQAFQLLCSSPYFFRTGLNLVSLTYRNENYTTFIMVVDIDDLLVIHSDSITMEVSDLDASFEIRWNISLFESSLIAVRGFQIDSIFNSDNDFEEEIVARLDFHVSNNTGLTKILPRPIAESKTLIFSRRVQVVLCDTNNRNLQIVRIVTLLAVRVCEQQCLSWHKKQPSSIAMRAIVNQASLRNPCPPAVGLFGIFPLRVGNFQLDGNCNPLNPLICNLLHPGARACYKSVNNFGLPVVQCCYDNRQRLILGPPAGGRLNFVDSRVSILQHLRDDIIPYFTCCKCANLCSFYYEKRPSIDSSRFRPPTGSNGGGDPHFTTIDGSDYTFNPVGEFIYLTTKDDLIQVRISQFVDENGSAKQASYFSAFAFKSASSDVIQVELNDLKLFSFRINGETQSLDYGVWNFNGASLNYVNSTSVEVFTSTSIVAEIFIHSGILNIFISLPHAIKGEVNGLVGNWDDLPENDLQLPNGSFIPLNSSTEDIHNIFGMSWKTNNSISLFSYPTGLTWNDYQNSEFRPVVSAVQQNPLCNGNAQCNYDVHVTGDINVGLTNVARLTYAADVAAGNSQISSYCPLSVSVNNGAVRIEEETDSHVTYYVTCNKDYSIDGDDSVICVNGQYDQLPTCNPQGISAACSRNPALIMVAMALMMAVINMGQP